jgi:phage terminase Nu1 subunit (DNA packaging protein)
LRCNKQQCCEILGWTKHTFDRNVRDGMPVEERPSGRGGDYIVCMGDVHRWLVKRALEQAGHKPGERAEVLDLNVERARLTKEQADKTEIENQLARKELLPAVDVSRTYETLFTVLRDRVMAVASVAPLLHDAAAGEGLPKVRALLRGELAAALDEVGSAELAEKQAAA